MTIQMETPGPANATRPRKRRVLIVDDSRTIRALLRSALEDDARIEVVGEASDAYEARERIKQLSPDVLTLDVEMPRMTGLEFLDRLMRLRPMPVVMVSTRTRERSADAIRALSLGAVDCVDVARLQTDPERRARLAETLVLASHAVVRARAAPEARSPDRRERAPYRWNGRIVLVGSSTGGVDALERVLFDFPPDGPPILIAQHMPQAFLKSFAQRLNDLVAPRVRLAEHGMRIAPGEILIGAGGDRHIGVSSVAGQDRITTDAADGRDLYVPSVDQLFGSGLSLAPRILSVVLTGMGRDGAAHLRALKDAGALVFAQSGDTAVVDGMPRAARETGAADRVVPLDEMGRAILEACAVPARRQAPGHT